jgi:hypothetical protein
VTIISGQRTLLNGTRTAAKDQAAKDQAAKDQAAKDQPAENADKNRFDNNPPTCSRRGQDDGL